VVTCPNAVMIPAQKLIFLTNLNTITCPTCASKFELKNKGTGSLIGGIGGWSRRWTWTLFGIYLLQTGNAAYLGLVLGAFLPLDLQLI
jgi:hypothetical protein